MTEYVSLKKKDLVEVWEKSECEDVAEALEALYPDDLPPKEDTRDVTDEIHFEKVRDFFRIMHGENKVSTQRNASSVSPDGELTVGFATPNGGYRFEVAGNLNWKVIKEEE